MSLVSPAMRQVFAKSFIDNLISSGLVLLQTMIRISILRAIGFLMGAVERIWIVRVMSYVANRL